MQQNDKQKYYKFSVAGGGLVCESYVAYRKFPPRDGMAARLHLCPELGGRREIICEDWLDEPRKGELWTADSDPYAAQAKLLDAARKEADRAREALRRCEDAIRDIAGIGNGLSGARREDAGAPKKPPRCYLAMAFHGGAMGKFPLADVARALGRELPASVDLCLERDGTEMHASVQTGEAEYPGITVDASTRQAGDIWLGGFELPSECYPTRISARLYAGCGQYETDEPIAIVTHEMTDDARVMYRAGKYGDKKMHKLVYVDYKNADTRPWLEATEEAMPEHREDEAPR